MATDPVINTGVYHFETPQGRTLCNVTSNQDLFSLSIKELKAFLWERGISLMCPVFVITCGKRKQTVCQ